MRREDVEESPPQRGSLAATGRAQRITVEDMYSYENIRELPRGARFARGPYLVAVGRKTVYIAFTKADFDSDAQKKDTGWKFHVSLNDNNFKNVAAGWNVIYKILMKYGVNESKIVQNGVKLAELKSSQRGKQITIYQHYNPKLDWQTIIQEITEELKKNNVEPGYAPPSDRPIRGTNYVYYRTDEGENNEYQEGDEKPTEPNPEFEKFDIKIDNQLPVQEWNARAATINLSK